MMLINSIYIVIAVTLAAGTVGLMVAIDRFKRIEKDDEFSCDKCTYEIVSTPPVYEIVSTPPVCETFTGNIKFEDEE